MCREFRCVICSFSEWLCLLKEWMSPLKQNTVRLKRVLNLRFQYPGALLTVSFSRKRSLSVVFCIVYFAQRITSFNFSVVRLSLLVLCSQSWHTSPWWQTSVQNWWSETDRGLHPCPVLFGLHKSRVDYTGTEPGLLVYYIIIKR
jgi:hypothetical protein